MARVTLGPVPLDGDRRWMARLFAYELAGELWPVSIEVRLKPDPCWHDAKPADQDATIIWERRDCDCWPAGRWPGTERVPPGGLPVRLLRNLHTGRLLSGYAASVENLRRFDAADHPHPAIARHYRAMQAAVERPPTQRGRPRADPRIHLERLAALDAAYADDKTQGAAARGLGIKPQTLRVSLEWARGQNPPLWTRSGRGRRGQLTQHGRALIEEVLGT